MDEKDDDPVVKQTRKYHRPIGYEESIHICNLCETPTKFNDPYKLYKHTVRFHLGFDQKNKGNKRENYEDNKVLLKRWRGNDKLQLFVYKDDDNDNDNNDENRDDGYVLESDEKFELPHIRFG